MKAPLIAVFICWVLLTAVSLTAQEYMEDPAIGMKAATADYQDGNYEEAYKKFNSLATRFSLDGHHSVFRFMAAKSLYKAEEYDAAIVCFDRFVDDFPRSRFAPAALLFKGHCLYKSGMIGGAATAYLAAYDLDSRNPDAQSARDNLRPLIEKGMTIPELRQLITENPATSLMEELQFTLALRELKSGRYRSGMKSIEVYLGRFPRGRHSGEARELSQQYASLAASRQVIGLLAPASGSYSEYGRSMLEGANLAMKFLADDSSGLELIVKDTRGDAVLATKMAERLANEEPLAVIGPLRSESSVGAAVVLNKENIPLITPTASESGIASLGPNVFQVSPAIERLGQAMATYAVNELGIAQFAIISPDDVGGMAVSKAFSQTVYRLGGEVIYTGYYTTGATDFKNQIKPLRDILLMNTEEKLAAGEIDSTLYLEEPDPEYPDSVELIDSDDWPVSLGGLFLPGYPDELKLLIPQVRYHIIRPRFLGADGWDSEELIREVRRYVGDAVFATDFHAGSDEIQWIEFAGAFMAEYGHEPDKVAALTYDAVAMVLSGLVQGADTPEKMREYLSEIEGFQGVSCRITFKGNGRANNEIRIYSVADGKVASAK